MPNETEEKISIEEIDEFQACDKSEESKLAVGICKANDVDKDERTVVAIISTDAIDRDSEVLLPSGVQLDNFIKNPVIPWSHFSGEPPIAKALWIKKNSKRILAKIKFAATDRAEEVWQLFKQGFLNAFSVGFMPLKGHRPTPEEIKKNPLLANANYIFDEWELLEFSPVTVPANPEALSQAVKSHKIKLSDETCKALVIEKQEEEMEETIMISVEIPVKEFTDEVKVEPYTEVKPI